MEEKRILLERTHAEQTILNNNLREQAWESLELTQAIQDLMSEKKVMNTTLEEKDVLVHKLLNQKKQLLDKLKNAQKEAENLIRLASAKMMA
jgi:hypothetical protein